MATPESEIRNEVPPAGKQAEGLDAKLAREKLLVESAWEGIKSGVKETFVDRPLTTLAKAAISVGVGFAMARILPTRGLLGTGAKLFLAEQGASFLYDTGSNLATLGIAAVNVWGDSDSSDKSMHAVSKIFKQSVVDGTLMMAGGAIGHKLGSRGILALEKGKGWSLTERLMGRNRINPALEPEISALYKDASPAVFRMKSTMLAREGGVVSDSGTGFLLDNRGNALTCAHTVKGIGERETIILESGKKVSAFVMAIDRKNDLALLRVVGKELPSRHLTLGTEPVKGSEILAIGYPGQSHGLQVVSPGKFEEVHFSPDRFEPATPIKKQKFTAHVRPGQSGGPVLDKKGDVVGVVSMYEYDLETGEKFLHTPAQDVIAKFLTNWRDSMSRSNEEAIRMAKALSGSRY